MPHDHIDAALVDHAGARGAPGRIFGVAVMGAFVVLIVGMVLLFVAWACIAEPVLEARAEVRRQEERRRWLRVVRGEWEGED